MCPLITSKCRINTIDLNMNEEHITDDDFKKGYNDVLE